MPASEFQAIVWESTSPAVYARIRGNNGSLITQSSLSSIAYTVYDLTNGGASVTSGTFTISSTVFDTLQTEEDDAGYDGDGTGFNFKTTIPAAAFPDPGEYKVEIIFTALAGDVMPLIGTVTVLNRMGT